MAQPELLWGDAHSSAEMMGEGALIAKAVIQRDGSDVFGRPQQGFGSLLDADAEREFIGGNSE